MNTTVALGRMGLACFLAAAMPILARSENFSGAYVGGQAGFGTSAHELKVPDIPISVGGAGSNGPLAGVFAGFDLRANDFVTGLEVELEHTDQAMTFVSSTGVRGKVKRLWGLDLSLRGGIMPSDHTLIYLRGGYTRSRFKVKAHGSHGEVNIRKYFHGFHVGGGMETRISSRATLRLEYRYTHYTKRNIGSAGYPVHARPHDHGMRIGVAWHLGEPRPRRAQEAATEWTGAFAGVQMGAGAHNTRVSFGNSEIDGIGGDGLMGGAFLGHDFQFGPRTLLGAEIGASKSALSSKGRLDAHRAKVRLNYGFYVSARVGWLAQPDTLIYLRGGWMRGYFGNVANGKSDNSKADGLLAGLGMETRLNDIWRLRVEYRHIHFQKRRINATRIRPRVETGTVSLIMQF